MRGFCSCIQELNISPSLNMLCFSRGRVLPVKLFSHRHNVRTCMDQRAGTQDECLQRHRLRSSHQATRTHRDLSVADHRKHPAYRRTRHPVSTSAHRMETWAAHSISTPHAGHIDALGVLISCRWALDSVHPRGWVSRGNLSGFTGISPPCTHQIHQYHIRYRLSVFLLHLETKSLCL